MQIIKIPLSELILDPSNARKHSVKNLEAIKGSLKRFGQQKPIVIDKKNVIIAGNGTVMAAPTQKPISLVQDFFERWGNKNDLVADLFLGSGSTLIACEKTSRKCYGSEIDPHYCSIIIERYINFVGDSSKVLLTSDNGTKTVQEVQQMRKGKAT